MFVFDSKQSKILFKYFVSYVNLFSKPKLHPKWLCCYGLHINIRIMK